MQMQRCVVSIESSSALPGKGKSRERDKMSVRAQGRDRSECVVPKETKTKKKKKTLQLGIRGDSKAGEPKGRNAERKSKRSVVR